MNNKRSRLIPCGCGCDQTLQEYDPKGRLRQFIAGHQNTKRALAHWVDQQLIECECGCGQTLLKYDDHRRPRRSIAGHISKKIGITNSAMCSHIVGIKPRLIRKRARDKLESYHKQNNLPIQCQINDEYCKQSNTRKVKTRIHYKDNNPYNISLDNLILLCPLHHHLARKIKDWIDPLSLTELVDLSMKRFRYLNKKRKWRGFLKSTLHAEDRPTFSSITDDSTLNIVDNWRNKV
jgi:hypothetical protein